MFVNAEIQFKKQNINIYILGPSSLLHFNIQENKSLKQPLWIEHSPLIVNEAKTSFVYIDVLTQ
jgi:hypothetical protein